MPPRLTFGVEFEFSLATLDCTTKDPDPDYETPVTRLADPIDGRVVRELIAKTFSNAGLPARREGVQTDSPTDGLWSIGQDPTIMQPNDFYERHLIEISTPAYYYCPEALEAVRYGLHVLTREFRVCVDESCGLHVYVGNSSLGFDFKTFRNLMAFLWTFEPHLCQLHPNRPFGRTDVYTDWYYPPLRRESILAECSQRSLPPDSPEDPDVPRRRRGARVLPMRVQEGLSVLLQ
jgi:hypothetical protein